MRDIGLGGTAGAVGAVAVNLVLARPFGSVGTAIALTVGQLLGCLAVAMLGRGHPQLVIPWNRLGVLMVAAALVAVVSTAVPEEGSVGLRAEVLLGFLALALWEGTLLDGVRYARTKVARGRG